MSAVVFPFVFKRSGFREVPAFVNAVQEQSAGRRTLQKLHAAAELVVRGTLLFPNPGGTYAAFVAFWTARFGTFDTFLYKAQNPGAAIAAELPAVAAAQVDFDALRRFVDVSTLNVKKDGATQTLGVHYTVQNESGGAYVLGTSTKLVVHFASTPFGHVVALSYDFYNPMRFEGESIEDQEIEGGGAGGAAIADRTVAVAMRESGPGYSYAAIPNAL